MEVLKFGGTSVGSAERMKQLLPIIRQGGQKLIVLSAMSGSTNALVAMCRHVADRKREEAKLLSDKLEFFYREQAKALDLNVVNESEVGAYMGSVFNEMRCIFQMKDNRQMAREVLSKGELLSTFMFHHLLLDQGIRSVLLNAPDFLSLDENGEPDSLHLKERLNHTLEQHPQADVFIAQGFICKDHQGQIANLGRGGSDYSASLMGAAIQSENIQIWTDVDGMQNNDPRFIDTTTPIRHLSFDEAAELAYFGAKILHPQSILPARNAGIPVLLKNTLKPADRGTVISRKRNGSGFKAIAAKDGITAIKVTSSRMLMAYGFMRKVFEVFEKYRTSVDMITTSEVAISATIDQTGQLDRIVRELEKLGKVTVDPDQTIIAAVGELVAENKGYANKLFAALQHIPIRMISYGASDHNISILVNSSDKVRTLQAIHQNLFSPKSNEACLETIT